MKADVLWLWHLLLNGRDKSLHIYLSSRKIIKSLNNSTFEVPAISQSNYPFFKVRLLYFCNLSAFRLQAVEVVTWLRVLDCKPCVVRVRGANVLVYFYLLSFDTPPVAISKRDTFHKWGKNFLRSIILISFSSTINQNKSNYIEAIGYSLGFCTLKPSEFRKEQCLYQSTESASTLKHTT